MAYNMRRATMMACMGVISTFQPFMIFASFCILLQARPAISYSLIIFSMSGVLVFLLIHVRNCLHVVQQRGEIGPSASASNSNSINMFVSATSQFSCGTSGSGGGVATVAALPEDSA